MRVVRLKRRCFLLRKIRCRINFPPFDLDLISSNMNAMATCLQHVCRKEGSQMKWLINLAGQRHPMYRVPISGSTKAMTWPIHTPSTVSTTVTNLSHRGALGGYLINHIFQQSFNCSHVISEQINNCYWHLIPPTYWSCWITDSYIAQASQSGLILSALSNLSL